MKILTLDNLVKNRITVIAGHYGTGKTNISVNLAESMVKSGKQVSIVDFDIVNPYFRSADNVKELKELGVKTIIPEYANTNVEIPSLPKEYYSIFNSDNYCVVDVGGDADGAIALAVDYDKYEKCGYTMYFVYNFYRPMISDPQKAFLMLKNIESVSKLRFSGIINNSNLGTETTKDLIESSFPAVKELSLLSGLPVVATTALSHIEVENAIKIQNKTKQLF